VVSETLRTTELLATDLTTAMQVFHKLEDVPTAFGPSLVSVGNFDGVHRAHANVLNEIVRRARQSGGRAVAVTFEPHPARILRPDSGLKLLTPYPRNCVYSKGPESML